MYVKKQSAMYAKMPSRIVRKFCAGFVMLTAMCFAHGQTPINGQPAGSGTPTAVQPGTEGKALGTKGGESSPKNQPAAGKDGAMPGLDDPNQKGSGPPPVASGTPSPLGPTDPATPPMPRVTRPKIGLALGGGGALGFTEIGVLQWFEDHHVPVDVIAGTSMGSLVGALYATGRTPQHMQEIVTNDVFSSVFQIQSSYAKRSFRRREDSRELPNGISAGLKHGVSFRNSVFADSGLNSFLVREFVRYDDQTSFNDLPIPFRAIASDLGTAETVTFARGSLPNAVRASVAIPGIYQPFAMNGHEYVDGGVLENLPTATVQEMKPDVVLAVSIPLQPLGKDSLDSILGVFQRSFSVAVEANERRARQLADVVILPDINGFGTGDYAKVQDLAKRGYDAAEKMKPTLIKYSVSEEEWSQYLAEKAARMRGEMGSVLRVEVKAPSDGAKHAVEHKFAAVVDRSLDTKKVDSLLSEVEADGRYQATYTVGYESHESMRPILLVTVNDKQTGPPFLSVGGNVQAQSGGVTRASVEGIWVDQDFGGYGSELRGRLQVGYGIKANLEYYRNFNFKGFFAAPRGVFERQPYYIYSGEKRLSQRVLQTVGGGGDLGWTNERNMELRTGWQGDQVRWRVDTGADGLPDYSGLKQRGRVRFVYDTQDRALVPQYGLRIESEAAYLYRTQGSVSTPQLFTHLTFAHTTSPKNDLILTAEGGTMLNRNVAQPFRYTLGGPYRLSANALDQFRGTDYFLVQGAYLRQIAKLPQLLGQNIFAGGLYEAGQMRAPDARTILRQDVQFGIVAETPLGVITIGPAIGDGGHYRLNFTLGKLF